MGYNAPGMDFRTAMTQDSREIARFADILRESKITSLLEIGSRYGGSLWYLAQTMPRDAKIVSVDSGKGQGGNKMGAAESLSACIQDLRDRGYDAHLIKGWSSDPAVIAQANARGPYDAVFIDGDHSYMGVKADWANYGGMARKLVAFHDVAWEHKAHFPRNVRPVEVPRLWRELREHADRHGARHETIEGNSNMGIGVLWL